MTNTKSGGNAMKQTMIAKFGSEEAWKEYMRANGRAGGKASGTGGFYYLKKTGQHDKIRQAGAKGGKTKKR